MLIRTLFPPGVVQHEPRLVLVEMHVPPAARAGEEGVSQDGAAPVEGVAVIVVTTEIKGTFSISAGNFVNFSTHKTHYAFSSHPPL